MTSRKKIVIILLSIGFISVFLSCGDEAVKNGSDKEISSMNLVEVNYAVEGMVCAVGCAKTIQERVSELDGIAACSVDFETGKAVIGYDKTQLDEQEIIAEIEGLGDGSYKVSSWEKKSGEVKEAVPETSGDGTNDQEQVFLPSFELPNLFVFLIDRI